MRSQIPIWMILVGAFFSCISCVQQGACQEFAHETYPLDTLYALHEQEIDQVYAETLSDFGETSVKDEEKETYLFTIRTAFYTGQTIKLSQDSTGYRIRTTCFNTEKGLGGIPECATYEALLPEEHWLAYKKMITEFDYWTEEKVRFDTMATDGYTYFIEGSRPEAARCGKRSYMLTLRGNSPFDKIDALCKLVFEYEEWQRYLVLDGE